MTEHRVPDELLPEGVSGATWDFDVLRAAANAHCRHPFNHTMEVKAWVVLHLLLLVEESLGFLLELEKRRTCLVAARDDLESITRAKTEDGGLWIRAIAQARIPLLDEAIENTDRALGGPPFPAPAEDGDPHRTETET